MTNEHQPEPVTDPPDHAIANLSGPATTDRSAEHTEHGGHHSETRRPDAISPSKAAVYYRCPLQFRLGSIDRIPQPQSAAAARGTLVHAVLEKLFDLPASQRQLAAAQELLKQQWEVLSVSNPDWEQLFTQPGEFELWYTQAQALLEAYFNLENPQRLEPAARETLLDAVMPSGLRLRGIIDRIDIAPQGQMRVVDYKTGKAPAPQYQADALFQMRFYAYLLLLTRGAAPTRTQLIYLKSGKTLTFDPQSADLTSMAEQLDQLWQSITDSLTHGFVARTSPLCNWCNYQNLCPKFSGQTPELKSEDVTRFLTAKTTDVPQPPTAVVPLNSTQP